MKRSTEVGSRWWIGSLAALTATTALSIDMSLPAQPTIAREFGVGADVAQLTLSLFMVGYAAGQLLVGYLSDAFGRRPVLVGGLALFTLAGALCAVSPTMPTLLAARVVQGAGASSGPVLARAMVRDTQPVASAARILATIMTALAVAPMIAPTFGGALVERLGWHAIFGALTIVGLALVAMTWARLSETLPVDRRSAPTLGALAKGMATFFRTPGTRAPTLLVCLSFGGQFAFISDSPFVLIGHYRVPPAHYGYYFATTAAALMAGAALGSHLLKSLAPSRVVRTGTLFLCAGGVITGVSVRLWPDAGPLALVLPILFYFLGVGLTGSPSTALAMEPVPEVAGTASALIGGMQMLAGGLSGWAVTRVGGSDPQVLAAALGVFGTAAATLALTSMRQ